NSWCREINSPNPSLYGAWNSGTLAARGEAVAFWPMDDFRYPAGIKEAHDLIQKGADVVYSPFRVRRYFNILGHDVLVYIQKVDKQVPEFNDATYPEFLHSMHCGPFYMFNKNLYFRVG